MDYEKSTQDQPETHEPTGYDTLKDVPFAGEQATQEEQPEQAEQSEQELLDKNLHFFGTDFLNSNYKADDESLQEGGEFAERYQEFLNSPDLVTLAKNGITIQGLYGAGLLKRGEERSRAADIFGPMGVEEVVTEIANFFETYSSVPDSAPDEDVETISEINEEWRNQFIDIYNKLRYPNKKLDIDDYIFLEDRHLKKLSDLIRFGLPGKDGDEKTLNYINTIDGKDTYTFHPSLLTDVMDKIDSGQIANENNDVSNALGNKCRENMDIIIEKMKSYYNDYKYDNYSDTKQLILRSLTGFDLPDRHNQLAEAGITDTEMLDYVYCLRENFGDITSFAEWQDPLHKLARRIGPYEAGGFSRDSIVNFLHDKEARLSMTEITDMREAGVDDISIIYAGRCYEDYFPHEGDFDNPAAWVGGGYPTAHFSAEDMLAAALRDIRNRED